MKRYMLFGEDGYPQGGAEDYIASFDTYEEALEYAQEELLDEAITWAQIFDTQEETIVYPSKELRRG